MTDPDGQTLTLEQARAALAAQPFSALLSAELAAFEPGRAVLTLRAGEEHRQQHDLVHGGVIAYLVDNAVAFAGGSRLGPDVVSRGFTVELVRPARPGALLSATAIVEHATARTAYCRCEVRSTDPEAGRPDAGYVVALGHGTVARRRRVDAD